MGDSNILFKITFRNVSHDEHLPHINTIYNLSVHFHFHCLRPSLLQIHVTVDIHGIYVTVSLLNFSLSVPLYLAHKRNKKLRFIEVMCQPYFTSILNSTESHGRIPSHRITISYIRQRFSVVRIISIDISSNDLLKNYTILQIKSRWRFM